MNAGLGARRGAPLILAGLGLFAYSQLSPALPRPRHIQYELQGAHQGTLHVRWREQDARGETLSQSTLRVREGEPPRHVLTLADGDYFLEAELPQGRTVTRRLHLDQDQLTVPLE